MPYPNDGELYLWGGSKDKSALRFRLPSGTSTFFLERLDEDGAWRHLTYDTGTGALHLGAAGIVATSGAGVAGGTNVSVTERIGHTRETVLTFANEVIAVVDAAGAGAHGGLKIYDFPEGNIYVNGIVVDLAITAGAGGISDTAAVVAAIGKAEVQTDNATLFADEATFIPMTNVTLVGGAADFHGLTSAQEAGQVQDGTSTAIDLWLNFAVPGDDSTADDTLTVTGTITILWAQLGDH